MLLRQAGRRIGLSTAAAAALHDLFLTAARALDVP